MFWINALLYCIVYNRNLHKLIKFIFLAAIENVHIQRPIERKFDCKIWNGMVLLQMLSKVYLTTFAKGYFSLSITGNCEAQF